MLKDIEKVQTLLVFDKKRVDQQDGHCEVTDAMLLS